MKKSVIILIVLVLLMSLNTRVLGSNQAINSVTKQMSIDGLTKTVNIVTLDLNNPNMELGVVVSNDVIGGNEDFKSIIDRTGAEAAINANFFAAYDSLEPYGTIMKDGKLIYLEGENSSMAVKDGNVVLFDRFQAKISGYLDGKRQNQWNNTTQSMDFNLFEVWYVNNVPTDNTGVYIYTLERGESITLEGGVVIEVINNLVTKVTKNAQASSIPKNGYLIYYGSMVGGSTGDTENYVDARFKIGRTVELELNNSKSLKNIDLNKIDDLISAGPYLVREGKIIVNATSEGFAEDKITKGRAQRSAIGITKDNRLLMVTVGNANMDELAKIMLELGAIEAINLDGGASSALYANGKTITNPGRKLSTVLVVYDRSKENALQNQERLQVMEERIKSGEFKDITDIKKISKEIIGYTTNKFSDINADSWYTTNVSYLVGLNIISGYTDGTFKPNDPMNVDAFTKMIITALKLPVRVAAKGEYWAQPFIDKAVEMGIIHKGEFDNYIRPITRGEIARMIVRAIDEPIATDMYSYSEGIKDYSSIKEEYKESVLRAYVMGIMGGFGDGTFGANDNANRASASTMILRMIDKSVRVIPKK